MADRFRADGDSWHITGDEVPSDRAVRTIVFHCVSNSQRPYRVVEVADQRLAGKPVAELRVEELNDLFARSHTMDYSRDAAASPESHGYGDPPLR